jgi:hypothetical protein
MTGAQNAVLGDQDLPLELPQSSADADGRAEERQMAKYSESEEYRRIKDHLQDRIKFFQKYFPGGQPVKVLPVAEREAYWVAACVITDELQSIINDYDQIREGVKKANARSENP